MSERRDQGDRGGRGGRAGRGGRGDDERESRGGGRGGRGGGGGRGKVHGMSYIAPKTPSFLTAFKAQLAGAPPPGSNDPYTSRSSTELGENGQRAALPGRGGRQTSEEREEEERRKTLEGDDFGWGEGGDDAPQVVVLKEGKHLSFEEMEDERRKVKGLPPIDRNPAASVKDTTPASATASKSSSSTAAPLTKSTKRKAVAVGSDSKKDCVAPAEKKKKKEKKGLLSFDEEG